MTFSPKFVDLVRNQTMTSGTIPIVLGVAIDGYTSFAAACAPGDQFYYSIQGVDRPSEREVGRGTMLPDGTIGREAIDGALTNFKSGAKTIALVAAAEWYQQVSQNGGSSSSAVSVADRSAMAALTGSAGKFVYLAEAGREGAFLFETGDHSAKVTADPLQGIVVPPSSDTSGASGAWVRQHDGPVNVRWFGATGDGTSDDSAAFVAAIASLKASRLYGYGYGGGSGDLHVPAGHYFLNTTTLDITHTMRFGGEGMGLAGGSSTVLRWAAGTTGIRVQAYNTQGATGIVASPPDILGGNGSTIEKMLLRGGWTANAAEGEYHGIHLRASAAIRDCFIEYFGGDGIYANCAATAGDNSNRGNANISRIVRCTIQHNRNGIFFDGPDANACSVDGCNLSANRAWGVWDSSFLGNNYNDCHFAANGWDGAIGSLPTACTLGGNRYYVKPGQAAGAGTNAPSGDTSDNQWWGYLGAGGTYNGVVAWVSGTVFREGGCYRTDDVNARNLMVGCYTEGDQNPAQTVSPTMVIGGLQGASVKGNASQISPVLGRISTPNLEVTTSLYATGSTHYAGSQSGAANDTYLYLDNTSVYSNIFFRSWSAGAQQTDASLRSWRGSGMVVFSKSATLFQANAAGSVFKISDTAAEVIAGNFKLGYGSGSGGTVTQATDKATGVTLNKACGKISMNAASLAAGAVVSFTLTNSVIAASDVVQAAIGSAATAGAYALTVDAIATGSCRLSLRNLSGAALAEAVTINFAVIKASAA